MVLVGWDFPLKLTVLSRDFNRGARIPFKAPYQVRVAGLGE